MSNLVDGNERERAEVTIMVGKLDSSRNEGDGVVVPPGGLLVEGLIEGESTSSEGGQNFKS